MKFNFNLGSPISPWKDLWFNLHRQQVLQLRESNWSGALDSLLLVRDEILRGLNE